MKNIILLSLFICGMSSIHSLNVSSEKIIRSEEINLDIIESRLLTSGYLSPGTQDLIADMRNLYIGFLYSRLSNLYLAEGLPVDGQRLSKIYDRYLNLKDILVSSQSEGLPVIKDATRVKPIESFYKNSIIKGIGFNMETWMYTFDTSGNITSRWVNGKVAYQYNGEAFTRIDFINFREFFIDGEFQIGSPQIEVSRTLWIKEFNLQL